VIFASALLAPGYVAGSLLNIADFGRRSAAEQAAWSIALSFGIGTLFIVAAVWLAGVTAASVALALITAAALMMWLRSGTRPQMPSPLTTTLVVLWTLVAIHSVVELGSGSRLWMSVTAYDHSVRAAFVDAVLRTGVPPANPLYWPGHDAPLRYYYFWYVTCAVVAKLAHISARQAFIASCVWPAFAVAAMLALYGKYLLGWTGKELRSRTRLGIALLMVTGLDLLMTFYRWHRGHTTRGDLEWWSIDQVTSWFDTFLWVPHHAAGLVCCLFTFLIIWVARTETRTRQRTLVAVVAGLSFASAVGLSAFVAIGFSMVMSAWLLRMLSFGSKQAWQESSRLLAVTAMAILVAAVTLGPYAAQLLAHGANQGATQHPAPHVLTIQIRRMFDPNLLIESPRYAFLKRYPPATRIQAAALIRLLPGYAIEFGFFGFAVILACGLRQKSEGERTLIFLFFASLISISFVRSSVIETNDFGIRASLLAQFFAVPLAVRVWETSRDLRRAALLTLALIGICGTIYQAAILRLFLPWQQLHANPAMLDLAERDYALRDVYTQFNESTPRSARIQYDTSQAGYFDYAQMLNAGHQIVSASADCNIGFGGEQAPCDRILRDVHALFTPPGNAPPAEVARVLCGEIGAQYLVATRWDAAWRNPAGWVWNLRAVVATPDARIVACSTS
jgi:hypothetical protein